MSTAKKAPNAVAPEARSTHQPVPPYEPTLEEIRARAYEIHIHRGQIDGFDLEDWLQAEKELREKGEA